MFGISPVTKRFSFNSSPILGEMEKDIEKREEENGKRRSLYDNVQQEFMEEYNKSSFALLRTEENFKKFTVFKPVNVGIWIFIGERCDSPPSLTLSPYPNSIDFLEDISQLQHGYALFNFRARNKKEINIQDK